MVRRSQSSTIRYVLGGLLAFGALNAFGGGYYGLSGAELVSTEWLEGSPFSDYTVPSVVLLVVVGGSFLVAAVAVFVRSPIARTSALTAGTVVLVWIGIQVAIIGYVSWMQPATAIGPGCSSSSWLLGTRRTHRFPPMRPSDRRRARGGDCIRHLFRNATRSDRTLANSTSATVPMIKVSVPQIGSSPGAFVRPRCMDTTELTDSTNR